jgi:hypothetical protein
MLGDDPSPVPSLLEEHARALLPSDGLAHVQTVLTGPSLLEDGLVVTCRGTHDHAWFRSHDNLCSELSDRTPPRSHLLLSRRLLRHILLLYSISIGRRPADARIARLLNFPLTNVTREVPPSAAKPSSAAEQTILLQCIAFPNHHPSPFVRLSVTRCLRPLRMVCVWLPRSGCVQHSSLS